MRAALLWLTVAGVALGADARDEIFPGRAAATNCSAGYTGEHCENVICASSRTLYHHDGQTEQGETIEYGTSQTCNGVFQFFVDQFMGETFITLATTGQTFPSGILNDPNNQEVLETQILYERGNLYVVSFLDLVSTSGPGNYSFTFRSTGTTSCYYLVESKSTLVVDGGFVVDPFDDYVTTTYPEVHQGVNRMPRENTSAYFAFATTSQLGFPGEPLLVSITMNNDYTYYFNVMRRYGCKANAYVGPYTCTRAGRKGFLRVGGYDMLGNVWWRVYQIECLASGPAPTVTVAPPSECINGGIMVNGTNGTPECYCGQFFEGNECQYKRCFNDGELQVDGQCYCRTGYSGTYCQDVRCAARSGQTFDLSVRALTFILRGTRSMAAQISEAVRAANAIKMYARNFSPYFVKFNLVVVANGVLNTYDIYDTFDAFILAIQNIKLEDDQNRCDDSLFMALSSALNLPTIATYMRSPIFVFSDGLSDDNQDAGLTLLHQLAYYRGQIFFMLTDSVTGRCDIDMAAQGYRTMRYIAWFTHGLVSHVPLTDLSETTRYLAISTFHTNYLLTNDLLDSCNRAPKYQAFFVDENIRYFFVIGTGTGLHLSLTNPDRNVYNPLLVFQGGNNTYVWQVANNVLLKGSYLISMTADGPHPCHYRVLGLGDYDLFVGIASRLTYDAKMQQPVMNEESHIVAHINNVVVPNFQDVNAEATIWTNEGESDTRTVLYASNGYMRDYCDFYLYFGAWKCTVPYQFFYINVYITDQSGFALQRTTTGYCSTIDVTPSPDDGCMNGGVRVNGTCECPAQWTGSHCQTIRCLNDGTVVADTTCVCVNGFSGDYCEKTSCYERNQFAENMWSPNRRSLSFLIHTSIPTRSTIRAIREAASRLVQDIKGQHAQWISNYQVIRFNHDHISVVRDSPDPNEFLAGLSDVVTYSQRSEVSCGDLQVLSAVMAVLESDTVTDNGIIYVFMDGYMKVDVSMIPPLYDRLEYTRVQLNVAMLAESPCGHTLSEPASTNLMNLVAFSGGQWIMVMPSNAGPVVSMIPSLYRGSFVYDNYVSNCTIPQTFYFPVDSQMQAFTSYVVGEMAADTPPLYFDPSGTRQYPFNVWTDVGLGSRLDQVIQACDEGWNFQQGDNHCWMFVMTPANWLTARNWCHSQGAVLATIYTPQEQAFVNMLVGNIDYWTGLNDLMRNGDWVWDQLGSAPLSLNNTQYTNWGQSQPDMSQITYQCVVDRGDRGWYNVPCGEEHLYICSKHPYNVDLEPTSVNIDLLPRGIWKAVVQTMEGPCHIQIFAQSGIQVYDLYTIEAHSDKGNTQPHQKANDNRIIAHTTNQQLSGQGIEGQLQYAHMYTMNMSIIQAQTFDHRDSEMCAFEYISTGFRCPDYTFQTLSTGIDRYGYLYQRIQPVKCLTGPASQAECFNGGVYFNGRCVCAPRWDGENCEQRTCDYGYRGATTSQCICYYGYVGLFCETPQCNHALSVSIPTPDNKTFVLLLDGGLPTYISSQLTSILSSIVVGTSTRYPNWFLHYTGVVFREDSNNTDSVSDAIEKDSATEFVTAMVAEATKPYTPTNTSRVILTALLQALTGNSLVQPRSPIFILTTSSAADYFLEDLAFTQIAKKHAYVYPVIVGDTTAPGGGTVYAAPEVGVLYDLSYVSGGRMYQTPASATNVTSFMQSVLDLLYNAYYVSTVQSNNCTGMTEYIQIGGNSSAIIVDVYATVQHTVTFINADQNTPATLDVAQSLTNTLITGVAIQEPGLWKVTINPATVQADEGLCSIAVRGVSTMDVIIAFSHDSSVEGDLHANSAELFPITGVAANRVVAQTNGGKLLFAQVFSTNERVLLWASPLIARSRCSYTYISQSAFSCVEQSLAVAVDGEDLYGHPIRRMIHVHCVGSLPPPEPTISTSPTPSTASPSPTTPLPTCDPNTPKFDTVIILDSSFNMKQEGFWEVTEWLNQIPLNVVIGPNNNRFMLGYYSDVTEYYPNPGTFSSINSTDDFYYYLSLLHEFGFSGRTGNNIDSIFTSLNTSAFRTDVDVQKLLIFFSTTSWTDGGFVDPQADASRFRRASINILPIGYGPLANQTQLQLLGCARMVANRVELDALMPWIVSLFCRTDQFC